MRDEAVLRRQDERLGLLPRPPAQVGLQLEVFAEQNRRQEQGQLQAVFVGRRERAERSVEVQLPNIIVLPDFVEIVPGRRQDCLIWTVPADDTSFRAFMATRAKSPERDGVTSPTLALLA